jgi:hypothetical protein
MDVLRAHAYLDLINDRPAAARIATAEPQDDPADAAESLAWAQAQAAADARRENGTPPGPGPNGGQGGQAGATPKPGETVGESLADPDDCPCTECDGTCLVDDYDLDLDDSRYSDGERDDGEPDDGEPDGGSDPDDGGPYPGGPYPGGPDSGGPGPQPGASPNGQARQRRPADLIVPLATLLGLAERPGDIHGFGLIDPALARELAAAGAASPRTEICVTVTSPEGYAIGHGCARPARRSRPPGPAPSPLTLPVRLNLTIPAAALPSLTASASRAGPGSNDEPDSHLGSWAFTPRRGPGARGDYGTWTLTLPGGRQFTVRLDPVPTFSCDHRYESRGYQPSDRLRHLVQIRDGTCTFPPCNRHARESDFEHAIPYDQGGRTCTCNAGARSRACHRVKQSPGWKVTQPKPGWHRWETPSGRVYVQEPKRYLD